MDLNLLKSFLESRKPEELYYLDDSKESSWIRSHYNEYGSLPLPETFENEFGVVLPEYCEDWKYYRKNLIDDDYVRKASPLLDEFNAKQGKVSPKEAIVWLRDKLAAVESKAKLGMGTSLINTMPSLLDHFKDQSGIRYPVGLKPYDDVSGGVGSDDILIVAARPGQGKSMIATAIGVNMVLMGLRVGFYSSEMKPTSIQARMASFMGGFSNFAITRGRNIEGWDDFSYALSDCQGDFIVLTPKDLGGDFATPQDIRTFISEKELDVVIIDQINGMKLSSFRGVSSEDHSKLAELQKQLTAIQKSIGIPFIEVLQLSREATGDNEPQLHMLAGSGRFEQDASTVLGCWRKAKDILVIKNMKSRDFEGGNLKWEFTIDFDKGKILPRLDGVSAVKNALQIHQLKADDDVMD